MCNAWNHPPGCNCGWGGDGYFGENTNYNFNPLQTRTSWEYGGSHDDVYRKTTCPICGEKVYFVRHNGGSVWFDELGGAWPKHGCFEDDEHGAYLRRTLSGSEMTNSTELTTLQLAEIAVEKDAVLTQEGKLESLGAYAPKERAAVIAMQSHSHAYIGGLIALSKLTIDDVTKTYKELSARLSELSRNNGMGIPLTTKTFQNAFSVLENVRKFSINLENFKGGQTALDALIKQCKYETEARRLGLTPNELTLKIALKETEKRVDAKLLKETQAALLALKGEGEGDGETPLELDDVVKGFRMQISALQEENAKLRKENDLLRNQVMVLNPRFER